MKIPILQVVIAALVISSVGCKKKQEGGSGGGVVVAPSTVVEPQAGAPVVPETQDVTPVVPEPVRLSPMERAKFLGFARYLPADAEMVSAQMKGPKSADRDKLSKLVKEIRSPNPGELDAVEGMMVDDPFGIEGISETEFTMAMGKSTGLQGSQSLKLLHRLEYVMMQQLVKTYAASLARKDADQSPEASGFSMEKFIQALAMDLIADPESGLGLFEKMQVPPIYLAFRATDENRGRIAQQVALMKQSFEEKSMMESVKTQVGGSDFEGYKLSGAKMAADLENEKSGMEAFIGVENANRLIAALAKKDLVVMSGNVGDYVVLFYGSSVDALVLAPNVESSLLATDALAFCDSYATKDISSVAYQQKEGLVQIMGEAKGLISDLAAGLRDGLAESSELGDTRNLQALLGMTEDRWNKLFALGKMDGGVSVTYFEDGLKVESCGGYDFGAVDWSASNRLASLGDGENVLMFANTTSDPVFDAKARECIEALIETVYAASLKASELSVVSPDMMVFNNQFKLVDARFRADLLGMWDVLHGDFSGALGGERALVVDLGGAMPPLPGIPQAMVNEGKFPRISMVAPLVDRSKLSSSWDKMNVSLTHVLGTISELSGKPFPMQQPISSEKNGFTTWFIAPPFTNADFMPTVTLNDKWFAASTSKNQSLDLLERAKAGGTSRKGFYMAMNFKVLDHYAGETLGLLEKHADALNMSASDIQEWGRYAKGLQELDSLTVHVRREAGLLRSSMYLKTR